MRGHKRAFLKRLSDSQKFSTVVLLQLLIMFILLVRKNPTVVRVEERVKVVVPTSPSGAPIAPATTAEGTTVTISPVWRVTPDLTMMSVPAANISEDFPAPCLIHRTVSSFAAVQSLPSGEMDQFYRSWSLLLPPYCHQMLWHNVLYDQLVALYMPEALDDYNWLETPTERSDFVRMLIMYHFGGVYADNDVELRRAPEHWTQGEKGVGLVVGLEYSAKEDNVFADSVAQYVFAAVPCHPIIKEVLDTIVENIRIERTTGDVYYRNYGPLAKVFERTGPQVLTRVMNKFFREHGTSFDQIYKSGKLYRAPGTDVVVLPHDCFRPHTLYRLLPSTMVVHYGKGQWKTTKDAAAWQRVPADATEDQF